MHTRRKGVQGKFLLLQSKRTWRCVCSAFSIKHPFIAAAKFHWSIVQLFTGTFTGTPGSYSPKVLILKYYSSSRSARSREASGSRRRSVHLTPFVSDIPAQSILLRPLHSGPTSLPLLILTSPQYEVSATCWTPPRLPCLSRTRSASYKKPPLSALSAEPESFRCLWTVATAWEVDEAAEGRRACWHLAFWWCQNVFNTLSSLWTLSEAKGIHPLCQAAVEGWNRIQFKVFTRFSLDQGRVYET